MQTTAKDIRIVPLADIPEQIDELAAWFVAEWAPYYGQNGPGSAVEDLTACCNRDRLPIALVALDESGELIATAALKENSVGSKPDQSPWLAAFIVKPILRGRGIGSLLVATMEDEARRLGFSTLYISTDNAENIVKKRGWEPLDTVSSLRGPITVYRCDLNIQGDPTA